MSRQLAKFWTAERVRLRATAKAAKRAHKEDWKCSAGVRGLDLESHCRQA